MGKQYEVIKDKSFILCKTRKIGDLVELESWEYQRYKDVVKPIELAKPKASEPNDVSEKKTTDTTTLTDTNETEPNTNNNFNHKKKEKNNG